MWCERKFLYRNFHYFCKNYVKSTFSHSIAFTKFSTWCDKSTCIAYVRIAECGKMKKNLWKLLSRNFCQKSVGVKFRNFHTVKSNLFFTLNVLVIKESSFVNVSKWSSSKTIFGRLNCYGRLFRFCYMHCRFRSFSGRNAVGEIGESIGIVWRLRAEKAERIEIATLILVIIARIILSRLFLLILLLLLFLLPTLGFGFPSSRCWSRGRSCRSGSSGGYFEKSKAKEM